MRTYANQPRFNQPSAHPQGGPRFDGHIYVQPTAESPAVLLIEIDQ